MVRLAGFVVTLLLFKLVKIYLEYRINALNNLFFFVKIDFKLL